MQERFLLCFAVALLTSFEYNIALANASGVKFGFVLSKEPKYKASGPSHMRS